MNEYVHDRTGYPYSIAKGWDGLWSKGIDAAINWGNGKVYFFKGNQYMRYDIASNKFDPGYPRRIENAWPGVTSLLNCLIYNIFLFLHVEVHYCVLLD